MLHLVLLGWAQGQKAQECESSPSDTGGTVLVHFILL